MSKRGFDITAAAGSSTIYVYGGINMMDDDGVMVDPDDFVESVSSVTEPEINVRIATVGGDPVQAGRMMQALIDHPAKVNTIVDTKAYSAGSMLLQAGDVRIARPMALVMVHGPGTPRVPGRGSARDHREVANAIDAHSEAMVPAYTRHGIDADTVRGWFAADEDLYFSAAQALEANLIDKIVDSMPLDASAPTDYRIAAMGGLDEIAAASRATPETATMADEKTEGVAVTAAAIDNDILSKHSRTVKKATQLGVRAEADRRTKVAAVFADFYDADPVNPVTALHDACLGNTDCTEIQAQRELLNYLASGSVESVVSAAAYDMPSTPQAPPRASRHLGGAMQISRDQQDKRAAGLGKALQIKSGLITDRAEIDAERSGEFLAMSLVDIMGGELRASGYQVGGMREDIARQYVNAMPILAAGPSHGTDHLPAVLGNIANLSAMQGWEGSAESWGSYTQAGTLNNYQTATRANAALLDKLTQMSENQEWEFGDMADVKQRITGYFYGLKYSLSIQAIVNDDLGELSRTMSGWGEAASATVGDAVYTLLTAAGAGGLGQVMDEDATVLFHANHGNYVESGAGDVPSETTLNTARSAMVSKNDQNNRKVAIRPQYLVHGPALWSTVRKTLNSNEINSVSVDGSTGATVLTGESNTARDMNLTPVEEYRFTANQWLLAAARRTIEVAGVGGPVSPRANQSMVSNTPGITYELSMPFGVAALDYRGLYYNHGA